MTQQPDTETAKEPAAALIAWYDCNRRELPWRAPPGEAADPYAVWLSEVMLQQTTVAAAAPYFARFMARWPTVEALAAAALDEVLGVWAGLGYYARARNLKACAERIADEHGGRFPEDEEGLRALPGIGPYTAAAIAAIAFGRRAVVVDGNVERVIARLFAVETPLPEARAELRARADTLTPEHRAGDFAQGMMDLGALVCTPKRPQCEVCPLAGFCRARALGMAEALPARRPAKARPVRRATAFWLRREDGKVLLRRRPPGGLLGGMLEVPATPWNARQGDAETAAEPARHVPARARWRRLPGRVSHTFTHFHLELEVWAAQAPVGCRLRPAAEPERCLWLGETELAAAALPSLMRKVAAHARAGGAG